MFNEYKNRCKGVGERICAYATLVRIITVISAVSIMIFGVFQFSESLITQFAFVINGLIMIMAGYLISIFIRNQGEINIFTEISARILADAYANHDGASNVFGMSPSESILDNDNFESNKHVDVENESTENNSYIDSATPVVIDETKCPSDSSKECNSSCEYFERCALKRK